MKVRSIAASALACTLLALASGCASSPNAQQALPGLNAPQRVDAGGKTQKVSFVFDAPASKSKGRTPEFLSGATKSIRLTVAHGKKKIASATMNLTLASKNCQTTLLSTVCSVTFALAAGKGYVASITAFDATKGKGKALSTGQSVAFNVTAGTATTVPLTLDGVPHSIVTKEIDTGTILVTALDADGNFIIGPGAPSFKASTSGSPIVKITQPTASSPNTFEVALAASPPAPPASETIGVTATYPKNSGRPCSQAGAVCRLSTIATARYQQQSLYFTADYTLGAIEGYSIPFASTGQVPSYSVPAANAYAITADAHGNVFASDYDNGTLYVVSPPYSALPVTDAGSATYSEAIALNSTGAAFVASGNSADVDEFVPPYVAAPTHITTGVNAPYGVATDASDNLYVGNDGVSTLSVYLAGAYTTQKYQVTLAGGAYSVTRIGSNLYVGESHAVEIFSLPITSSAATPIATISNGVNGVYDVTLDAAGDLWVANDNGGNIAEYPAPVTNNEAPSLTLSSGLSAPCGGLLFDSSGNLYVTDSSTEQVVEFDPPFTNGSAPAAVSNTLSDVCYGAMATTTGGVYTLSFP